MKFECFWCALGLSIALLVGPISGRAGAGIIPGDFDQDGDVDLADFAEFQTCARGPGISQSDPECSDARLDADPDVDLDDFAVFQGCLGGADNPADPNCACPSGQTNCDGTCTNTASDYLNCGACGNACATGLVCQNGSCAACGEGTADCGGACFDIWWDANNCGACGHQCQPLDHCSYGQCEGSCIGCEP